ncbi:MAG: 2OG-Fe(II) oxygenase [Rhizobiales bacterium]|nr:2OG-Fe(II) oxygenase [Hyphomicrobiales bacterium]
MTPILNLPGSLPSFDQRFAVVDSILPETAWRSVRSAVDRLVETERSYLPTHKKGGTVAYETLSENAPVIVALYRSEAFCELISQITGLSVAPTPLHDQSSCSILFYEKPGDHIGWHYDHNFYKGRHFTVLIPVVNRDSKSQGLSTARLYAKLNGKDVEVATPPNRMIVFEGARVRHKVTPIAEGERRVVWSMTYCTDPRNSAWQGVARRVKDTAFYGLRALWT